MGILTNKTIYVTGAGGFLGTVVCRKLMDEGARVVPNRMDLTNSEHGQQLPENIDLVIHLAADVKGISLNKAQPYRFLRRNSLMALEVIEMIRDSPLPHPPIVAAGSVCAYCGEARIPFKEEELWMGEPDESNYGYGMAKRFMCAALKSAHMEFGLHYAHLICANLYGPGDNFDPAGSHVIPGLIRRIHDAKINYEPLVDVWGSGRATRDFLYVDDAADAYVLAAKTLIAKAYDTFEANIGSGIEISVRQIAEATSRIVGYNGSLVYDHSKPDGQSRRLIDYSRAQHLLGWKPKTRFWDGLRNTIDWYKEKLGEPV